MQVRSWFKRLEACLNAAAATSGDPSDLRSLLFGLYRLIETGPLSVRTAFQDLSAEILSDNAQDLGEQLSQGEYPKLTTPREVAEGVELAATLLRGVEQALLGLGQAELAPRRARDLEVNFAEESGWVIPFPPRYRSEPSDWPPYFAKRALTRMRCIARELPSGHRINLQLMDKKTVGEIAGAACLFDKLNLIDQAGNPIDHTTVGSFVVDRIEGTSPQVIENCLRLALDADAQVSVVVFPELSISPDERKLIQRLLRTTPWDINLEHPSPALIVGGSWHDRREDGSHENRAPVFAGDGRLVGHHVKHAIFGTNVADKGVLREDIIRGEEILVVVGPDLTVAIAICLDFCQVGTSNPYDDLDVDLVLVASMAGSGTSADHGSQADRIWKKRKGATFLAQQNEGAAGGVCGASPTPKTDPGFVKESGPAVVLRRISPPA